MNVTVIGAGYVGLVSAAVLADLGHNVTCYDLYKKRIEQLAMGVPVIHENNLQELMEKNRDRLTYTCDITVAYDRPEVVIICVNTPEREDGSVELKYLYEAVDQAVDNAGSDMALVIKSTVPIGTNDKIQEYIKAQNPEHHIKVVSNPEFLSQGSAVNDTLNADRIIIGSECETMRDIMKRLYEGLDIPIIFTDRRSAEMIKYASNNFLALKISYINEIANLCELSGANINDVAKGMGMDPRIGNGFLKAGIGYGGSCFPKDTKALCYMAEGYGYDIKTVKAAIDVNEKQRLRLIEKSRKYYDTLNGSTVAVLGLTFKPGTDDLREAPALANIPVIIAEGAVVQVWDPAGMDRYKDMIEDSQDHEAGRVVLCDTPRAALNNADICFIFTEWPQIKELKTDDFDVMNRKIVLDGRNCLSIHDGQEGIVYDTIG